MIEIIAQECSAFLLRISISTSIYRNGTDQTAIIIAAIVKAFGWVIWSHSLNEYFFDEWYKVKRNIH